MAHGYDTDGEVLRDQGELLRLHGQHVMNMADRFESEATLPEGAFSGLLDELRSSYVTAMTAVKTTMFAVGNAFDVTGSAMRDTAETYVAADEFAVEELMKAQRAPDVAGERDRC
ncbi:MAG: hypothetical protein HOY78_18195 [Saccharothrix sp.]|nr:hypothetical protein [Saccharothrix sp.]